MCVENGHIVWDMLCFLCFKSIPATEAAKHCMTLLFEDIPFEGSLLGRVHKQVAPNLERGGANVRSDRGN